MVGDRKWAARAGMIATATAVAAGAAGVRWVWRHQDELMLRPPLNEWTFAHMSLLLPTETVPRADRLSVLPRAPRPLEFAYEWDGATRTLSDLHTRTHTTGFAVVHRGRLVHEAYPGLRVDPEMLPVYAEAGEGTVRPAEGPPLVGVPVMGRVPLTERTALQVRQARPAAALDPPLGTICSPPHRPPRAINNPSRAMSRTVALNEPPPTAVRGALRDSA